ncbi:hypothetical protein CXG81DRAFT_18258 [Caulochytrium protostelioides]|uniref:SEC7 domain-containing protein n=1 Tax=Caulochytrium protostelioides TaxID=1555241 RepID=A0A4P9X9K1_9FUNG|nr:hypothetical protein CXG81DRAFT_18258 [Caulochytrium protostelioides]|eukprot:RKP02023.1 hypothetical protein CXG81DRAFT_18258 [Caulochytrium protostelioides]
MPSPPPPPSPPWPAARPSARAVQRDVPDVDAADGVDNAAAAAAARPAIPPAKRTVLFSPVAALISPSPDEAPATRVPTRSGADRAPSAPGSPASSSSSSASSSSPPPPPPPRSTRSTQSTRSTSAQAAPYPIMTAQPPAFYETAPADALASRWSITPALPARRGCPADDADDAGGSDRVDASPSPSPSPSTPPRRAARRLFLDAPALAPRLPLSGPRVRPRPRPPSDPVPRGSGGRAVTTGSHAPPAPRPPFLAHRPASQSASTSPRPWRAALPTPAGLAMPTPTPDAAPDAAPVGPAGPIVPAVVLSSGSDPSQPASAAALGDETSTASARDAGGLRTPLLRSGVSTAPIGSLMSSLGGSPASSSAHRLDEDETTTLLDKTTRHLTRQALRRSASNPSPPSPPSPLRAPHPSSFAPSVAAAAAAAAGATARRPQRPRRRWGPGSASGAAAVPRLEDVDEDEGYASPRQATHGRRDRRRSSHARGDDADADANAGANADDDDDDHDNETGDGGGDDDDNDLDDDDDDATTTSSVSHHLPVPRAAPSLAEQRQAQLLATLFRVGQPRATLRRSARDGMQCFRIGHRVTTERQHGHRGLPHVERQLTSADPLAEDTLSINGRQFLCHGQAWQVITTSTVKARYLFLFNDVLIIAKEMAPTPEQSAAAGAAPAPPATVTSTATAMAIGTDPAYRGSVAPPPHAHEAGAAGPGGPRRHHTLPALRSTPPPPPPSSTSLSPPSPTSAAPLAEPRYQIKAVIDLSQTQVILREEKPYLFDDLSHPLIQNAVKRFSSNPDKAIRYLVAKRVLPPSPDAVAHFLHVTAALSPVQKARFLGNPENAATLVAYVEMMTLDPNALVTVRLFVRFIDVTQADTRTTLLRALAVRYVACFHSPARRVSRALTASTAAPVEPDPEPAKPGFQFTDTRAAVKTILDCFECLVLWNAALKVYAKNRQASHAAAKTNAPPREHILAPHFQQIFSSLLRNPRMTPAIEDQLQHMAAAIVSWPIQSASVADLTGVSKVPVHVTVEDPHAAGRTGYAATPRPSASHAAAPPPSTSHAPPPPLPPSVPGQALASRGPSDHRETIPAPAPTPTPSGFAPSIGPDAVPFPARLTIKVPSPWIALRIPKPDSHFRIHLYGTDLTCQPAMLSFTASATARFRIRTTAVGRKLLMFHYEGSNSGTYGLLPPRSIASEPAFMRHTFQINVYDGNSAHDAATATALPPPPAPPSLGPLGSSASAAASQSRHAARAAELPSSRKKYLFAVGDAPVRRAWLDALDNAVVSFKSSRSGHMDVLSSRYRHRYATSSIPATATTATATTAAPMTAVPAMATASSAATTPVDNADRLLGDRRGPAASVTEASAADASPTPTPTTDTAAALDSPATSLGRHHHRHRHRHGSASTSSQHHHHHHHHHHSARRHGSHRAATPGPGDAATPGAAEPRHAPSVRSMASEAENSVEPPALRRGSSTLRAGPAVLAPATASTPGPDATTPTVLTGPGAVRLQASPTDTAAATSDGERADARPAPRGRWHGHRYGSSGPGDRGDRPTADGDAEADGDADGESDGGTWSDASDNDALMDRVATRVLREFILPTHGSPLTGPALIETVMKAAMLPVALGFLQDAIQTHLRSDARSAGLAAPGSLL